MVKLNSGRMSVNSSFTGHPQSPMIAAGMSHSSFTTDPGAPQSPHSPFTAPQQQGRPTQHGQGGYPGGPYGTPYGGPPYGSPSSPPARAPIQGGHSKVAFGAPPPAAAPYRPQPPPPGLRPQPPRAGGPPYQFQPGVNNQPPPQTAPQRPQFVAHAAGYSVNYSSNSQPQMGSRYPVIPGAGPGPGGMMNRGQPPAPVPGSGLGPAAASYLVPAENGGLRGGSMSYTSGTRPLNQQAGQGSNSPQYPFLAGPGSPGGVRSRPQ